MKIKKIALTSALILSAINSSAEDISLDRLESQEKRINLLEQKMDKILQLMIAQTKSEMGSAAVPVKSKSAEENIPSHQLPTAANYQQGLILDVYSLTPEQNAPLPDRPGPKDFPLGRLVHDSGSEFSYGEFKNDKSLIPLGNRSTGKYLGQYFHGMVKIEKTGHHVFSLDLRRNRNSDAYGCKQVLSFDGESILTNLSESDGDAYKIENVQKLLEPGVYEIGLWQVCNYNHQVNHETIKGSIKVRGPGAMQSELLQPAQLMYLP